MSDGTGSTKPEDLGEFDVGSATEEWKDLNERAPGPPGDLAEGKEAIAGFGGLKQGPTYSSLGKPEKVMPPPEETHLQDHRGGAMAPNGTPIPKADTTRPNG